MSIDFVGVVQDLQDLEGMAEYGRRVRGGLERSSADLLAVASSTQGQGGKLLELNTELAAEQVDKVFETLEGPTAEAVSVIKFPDRKGFEDWYYSSEYQELKTVRGGSVVQAFIVEGL